MSWIITLKTIPPKEMFVNLNVKNKSGYTPFIYWLLFLKTEPPKELYVNLDS